MISPHEPREADDVAAPFLFLYIGLVTAFIVAFLAWVFWFRGYA